MTGSRKFFRVFLASPGDLAEERQTARRIVDEYNSQLSKALGYYAELVGWEDTLPSMGRPQAVINRDLEGCDLFVGMLWKRWGTPPEASGEFTSGFEEEFERSLRRYERDKRPQIHLLLKDIEQAALVDPGEQLKRVQAFRNRTFAERKLLAKTFANIADFERILRHCIQGFAIELGQLEEANNAEKDQAAVPDNLTTAPNIDIEPESQSPAPEKGISFLHDLTKRLRSEKEFSATAFEVARLRLLSSTFGTHGNDDVSLGTHDANLLYKDRKSLQLSRQEKIGLLDSALTLYNHQAIPLWHWVGSLNGFKDPILASASITKSPARQIGAISAMRLIRQPLTAEDNYPGKKLPLDVWFGDTQDKNVKIAALGYLADCGASTDIPRIGAELKKNDSQIENAAHSAILAILDRESDQSIFESIIELQPAIVDKRILKKIPTRKLSTESLCAALSHRNADVRNIATHELSRRQALPAISAEKLLTDDNANNRYEAIKALISSGRAFSKDDVKNILTKKGNSKDLLAPAASIDSDGEALFAEYSRQQLLIATEDELLKSARTSNFDQDAFITLAKKNPTKYRAQILMAISDRFKDQYLAAHARMAEICGDPSETIETFKGLEQSLRERYTRNALDFIVSQQNPEDLDAIRNAMKGDALPYSPEDIRYLEQFGSWDDISQIISILKRRRARAGSLLLGYADNRYTLASSALISLGGHRIDELLNTEMPPLLLAKVIAKMNSQHFKTASKSLLQALLRSEHVEVRKSTALKFISNSTKKQISNLLDEYLSSSGMMYYNVIYWLDFGFSVPRREMLRGALKELETTN